MEIHDITDYGFSFVNASTSYIPNPGVISGRLLDDGVVIAEVTDENVRWMTSTTDQVRRGQVLDLWATLSAGNYRYVLRYGFSDDGSIKIRAGGTAQNLRSVPVGNHDGVHIHMPAWRFEFDLGAPQANAIEVVERQSDPNSAAAHIVHRPFNGGLEGGEVWNPERFTTLMITSKTFDNRHDPPHKIGYKLVSARSGSTRTYREYTKHDFWVTRIAPLAVTRSVDRELRFIDVPEYVRTPEPIDGAAVAIWHSTALHHVPRTEDFGAQGYDTYQGLALTMWTGFDLMPHNLWDKTPLFTP
jgi:Cu2+-containing amine oxidase